jgi:3-hydroxyacyl-[acyl-carrier-protein] dehydratase
MQSVSAEAILFNPDPAAYLPHRYPFLHLDRIVLLEKGVQATALKKVTSQRSFPQVLLVECVAQLAGILTVSEEGEGGFLAAIDRAEFSGIPNSGDVLMVYASVIKSFGRLFMVKGNVSCDDRILLTVQLTLGVGRL